MVDFFANLRGVDLRNTDLRNANLYNANLSYTDLRGVDLRNTDLRNANFCGANLLGTDLSGADLNGADFIGADLRGARILDRTVKNYKEIVGIRIEDSTIELRCFMLDDNSFYFMTSFFIGTEDELTEEVINKYGEDCEYMEAINFLKQLCKKY